MHQIQPNGSIKDYLRNTDMNIKHKLKTSKKRSIQKKHRSKRKPYYSKSVTLYFAFMNIVLEIQTKSQLSQNSKLRMHSK